MKRPYVRLGTRVILVDPPKRSYMWLCMTTWGSDVVSYHLSEAAARARAAELHKAVALQIFWPVPVKRAEVKRRVTWRNGG